MRRKDREVADIAKIEDIIGKCEHLRLGLCDEGEVYIVPLSFGYVKNGDCRIFYFHSAKEGRKIDLIAKNPRVGFELDTEYRLTGEGDIACKYSASFKSIIGTGIAAAVTDSVEKTDALHAIMRKNTGKGDWTFEQKMLDSVCVFKLTVSTLSCKEHL